MAEIAKIVLSNRELVEAIIRHQNIHDGIWQLVVEFSLAAANIQTGEEQVSPAAIVPIKQFGLTKVDKESSIAVDASKVNPKR